MRGIMRRIISANSLLWFGLMAWAFGSLLHYIGRVAHWDPINNPSALGYDIADYSSIVGASCLFIGAAIKVIANLNSD